MTLSSNAIYIKNRNNECRWDVHDTHTKCIKLNDLQRVSHQQRKTTWQKPSFCEIIAKYLKCLGSLSVVTLNNKEFFLCITSFNDNLRFSYSLIVLIRVGKNPGFLWKTQPSGFFFINKTRVLVGLLGFIGFFEKKSFIWRYKGNIHVIMSPYDDNSFCLVI